MPRPTPVHSDYHDTLSSDLLVVFGKSIPSLFNPLISQQLQPKKEDTSDTDALDRVLLDESITCNIPFTCWFHKHGGRIGAPNMRLSSKTLDDLLDNMLQ